MKVAERFDSSLGRILELVYERRDLARHEIADEVGLTRTTVSKVVSELIAKGLIAEGNRGQASPRGGPRPIPLTLNDHAVNFIGLDIRREKITAAMINLGGAMQNVLVREMAPDAATTDFAAAIESAVTELKFRSAAPVVAIGVGSIGPVDAHAGVIRSTYFKQLECLPIVSELERRYDIPTALRVGSVMGAYGEACVAAAQAAVAPKSVAFIMVDYGGIGLGLISGGAAWLTDHGGVGELGHVVVDLNGRQCACGRKGCLVEYASGRVLVKQLGYHGRNGESEHSWLAQVAIDAESGDLRVQQAVLKAGEFLGCGIADIDRLLRPERIVIGSSHEHLAEWYMRGIRTHLEALPDSDSGPRLLDRLFLAANGSAAIAYGAAAMQLKHCLRSPSRMLDQLGEIDSAPTTHHGQRRDDDIRKVLQV
ncbi:MAG: ROK family transcriptional regulator [Casimicrobiaceae bacterium]